MEGISRIIHQDERDVIKILHPKIIKELPTLKEVSGLFQLLIKGAETSEYSDARLGYFFSSRKKFGYDGNYGIRRSWSIVGYPIEGESKFIVNLLLNGPKLYGPMGAQEISGRWIHNSGDLEEDPIFFFKIPSENTSSEHSVFLFRKDPTKEDYVKNAKRRGLRLPYFK